MEPDGRCVPTGPSEPVPIEPLPIEDPLEDEPLEPLVALLLLSMPPMLPQPSWLLEVQGGLVWLALVLGPALVAAGLPEMEPLLSAKAGAAIRARTAAVPIIRLFMTIPFAVHARRRQ